LNGWDITFVNNEKYHMKEDEMNRGFNKHNTEKKCRQSSDRKIG
jgi:hypothetical protein